MLQCVAVRCSVCTGDGRTRSNTEYAAGGKLGQARGKLVPAPYVKRFLCVCVCTHISNIHDQQIHKAARVKTIPVRLIIRDRERRVERKRERERERGGETERGEHQKRREGWIER